MYIYFFLHIYMINVQAKEDKVLQITRLPLLLLSNTLFSTCVSKLMSFYVP